MKLSRAAFETLVDEALETLPAPFREALQNIAVRVRPWPSAGDLREAGVEAGYTLLGLYHGIPLTERTGDYQLVAPDLITIFQGPIEAATNGTPEAIRAEVRHTVIHEIAHYFGIDDDRLRELGAY